MSKEVTYTISKDGSEVKVEAEGFQGTGCLDFAKKTMDALGQITAKEDKPEMFATGAAGVSIQS